MDSDSVPASEPQCCPRLGKNLYAPVRNVIPRCRLDCQHALHVWMQTNQVREAEKVLSHFGELVPLLHDGHGEAVLAEMIQAFLGWR
jgi:hypothetical protein